MTNHDLARAAVRTINMVPVDMLTDDDIADFIADTYAAPMAELERLNRQVAFVKQRTRPGVVRLGMSYVCLLCAADAVEPEQVRHHDECPHNEVAT